jgi:putative transposase
MRRRSLRPQGVALGWETCRAFGPPGAKHWRSSAPPDMIIAFTPYHLFQGRSPMPQSLSRVWLHFVFSTKDRQPLLRDEALREEMFKMLGHEANKIGCPSGGVGGWDDHVHLLCGLARTVTIAQLVEAVKRETSKWAKDRTPGWHNFYWQNGYGAFSVSQSLVGQVQT